MTTADVSLVLANYNHARYLPRALDAILAQSVQPREILAIDDVSTDNSLEVLDGYARRNPHLQVIRNEKNLGVTRNYNKGIGLAKSRYVLLAAADDYLLPGYIEKSMAQLEAHPEAGLSFTYDSYQVGDDGPIEINPSGWCSSPEFFSPEEVCRNMRGGIPGHAVISRRDLLLGVGGFLADLAWYSDWFAFLTIAFRHGACHVPETLAIRVLFDTSYSANSRHGSKNIEVLKAFFERITSAEFADVAPYFRRNGAATFFGVDLIRAAAKRTDRLEPEILGFLNGFSPEQYEELLVDPDPAVREIAAFFLGPFWRHFAEKRAQKENEIIHLQNKLEQARQQIPPPGALGKLRWLAGLATRRLYRAG
ncbi:MAG TPA: glycosyltransferase [Urbifossiella sp.]|jgi:glycosyltransferase involved in cell wall biosynthesis